MKQKSKRPTRKVAATSATAAVSSLIIWIATRFFELDIPPDVAMGIATIIIFAMGYSVPPSPNDAIEADT